MERRGQDFWSERPASAQLFEMVADPMSEHLRVRLRQKLVFQAEEFVAQGGVVLDDPVVDQCQFAGLIQVRMGVGIAGQTVSRPAGVADAQGAANRFLFKRFGQAGDAADALAHFQGATVQRADPGRIIAAVLQPPQPVQKDRHGLLFSDITYNSAHRERV